MSDVDEGFRSKLKVLREMRNYTVIWSGQVAYFVKVIRNVEDDIPDHGLDSETIGHEGSEEAPEEGTGEADETRGFPEEGPDET